ncbi:F0F1 ATP synthase subunit A [Mesomycoplasma lagogenitalium]|uniref:F0F1 ATP synthase subunit A n=1 Tax=Mesomycoplasma lagogenitalium TaxID=171286 RepID=A0ABY8LUN1_9BACT|nr:F0F1 ATP synthase subunit A [Mesomycoplasma lagogenitalium]WGI36253.1 F0F1 ATP synthase subunit A [Mesomycoplasma lagogenitalium]
MDKDSFLSNWNQPQLFTLFVMVFLICIISLILYFQIKKTKKDKAPNTAVYIVEQYFGIVDKLVDESSNSGRIAKFKPYLFGLLTFLLFGNLLSVIGLEPVGSTISVTLTLALISWLGIYVIGISYQRLSFFKKYINPLEIISIPAPLISLSFRMFGNIIGGSTLLIIFYAGLQFIWNLLPIGSFALFNLPAAIFLSPLVFYLDIFGVVIQSYVFTLLTTMFWSSSADGE